MIQNLDRRWQFVGIARERFVWDKYIYAYSTPREGRSQHVFMFFMDIRFTAVYNREKREGVINKLCL